MEARRTGEGGTRGRTTKYEECNVLLYRQSVLYLSPVFIRRHFRWNNKSIRMVEEGPRDMSRILWMLKIGLRERENKIM